MKNTIEPTIPSWGMKINDGCINVGGKCPKWANGFQRRSWDKTGLIIWDESTKTITHIWAAQALDMLEYVLTNNDWKQHGIVVGETTTRLSLDDPESEPKTVLVNKINLTPEQSSELFDYLQRNKAELEIIQEQDEQKEQDLLAQVYSMILSWPEKDGEVGP